MKEKKIAFIIVLSIFIINLIIACILIMTKSNNDNLKAEIWYENNLVETIDLTKIDKKMVKEIKLKDDLYIKVELKNNAIRVVDAPCHTKECVKTNWTSSVNKPIICMDLHYEIILKQNNNNVDVVV